MRKRFRRTTPADLTGDVPPLDPDLFRSLYDQATAYAEVSPPPFALGFVEGAAVICRGNRERQTHFLLRFIAWKKLDGKGLLKAYYHREGGHLYVEEAVLGAAATLPLTRPGEFDPAVFLSEVQRLKEEEEAFWQSDWRSRKVRFVHLTLEEQRADYAPGEVLNVCAPWRNLRTGMYVVLSMENERVEIARLVKNGPMTSGMRLADERLWLARRDLKRFGRLPLRVQLGEQVERGNSGEAP